MLRLPTLGFSLVLEALQPRAERAEEEPLFALHYYLLGSGKYGVTQLANLTSLPPTGVLIVVAPLTLTDDTGSPVRALALVPRG